LKTPSIQTPQSPLVTEIEEEGVEPVVEERVIFKPNEGPQSVFLAASERQILFGGSAGGGKSYAMLVDPVRYFDYPRFSGLLVRRTTEELRDLIRESKMLYDNPTIKGKWSTRDGTWTFPSGAQLWMSYLERDADVTRYQGQAYTWIGFDELTQWPTPYAWDYMHSRLRTTDKNLQPFLSMRASTNPGGPGHSWVKKMFIDPAPAGKAFWATDSETGEVLIDDDDRSETFGQPLFKRRFIPSSLDDNPYLARDGNYRRTLMAMPKYQREQLLYGNWDVAEGSAFTEWDRKIHVIEPFDVPNHWVKFRACDYGYGSYSGVLWFAIEPKTDKIIVYRELYVSKVLAIDLADMILDAERYDGLVRYGMLDSSLWHQRGDTGPSLADQMIGRGCRWRPADRSKGSRVAGKNEIHRRLQVDEFTGEPRMQIFDTCVNLIAQLPAIPLDKSNPEDVDTNYAHDHLYDALRYGLRSRPRSSLFDFNPEVSGDEFNPSSRIFGY
jgi:hypothetical protein